MAPVVLNSQGVGSYSGQGLIEVENFFGMIGDASKYHYKDDLFGVQISSSSSEMVILSYPQITNITGDTLVLRLWSWSHSHPETIIPVHVKLDNIPVGRCLIKKPGQTEVKCDLKVDNNARITADLTLSFDQFGDGEEVILDSFYFE